MINGFCLGTSDHFVITEIPWPLALAGGFTIHLVAFFAYRGQAFFKASISWGRINVLKGELVQKMQILVRNSLLHKSEFIFSILLSVSSKISPNTVFPADFEGSWNMIEFLVRSDGLKSRTFHVLLPNRHPVCCFCENLFKMLFKILVRRKTHFL